MDKLDFLIQYLLKERNENFSKLPTDIEEKKRLYRALVNIREPDDISPEFLTVEDEYLQEELQKKECIDVHDLPTIDQDKICLWQGDITRLKIDAIVNAANSAALGCFIPNHHCIDNQIHSFAGVRLRQECLEKVKEIGGKLPTGKAFITKGYNLPARNVIHTVGPIFEEVSLEEADMELANCYENSLKLAVMNHLKTIAFPCISTGIFHFPPERACQIAIRTVDHFLASNRDFIEKVVFNVYTDQDFKLYQEAMK